jgi:hypothetical protein
VPWRTAVAALPRRPLEPARVVPGSAATYLYATRMAPLLSLFALALEAASPASTFYPVGPAKVVNITSLAISAAPPTIDARLDEPLWADRTPITDFVQDEPEQGQPASERTEVVLAVDQHALYVGARLFDRSPPEILARLGRRDRDVTSDAFLIFLDPQHDRRGGVYFGVNAGGTQYDGILSNDDWRDDSWDGVWESAVARDDRGWTVEMRIPLSQLRFDGGAGRRWGINIERIIARKKEHALLAYTPRAESGFVSRFWDLAGVEQVIPPARLEVTPYLSGSSTWKTHAADDPFADRDDLRGRAGLDVKLGLTGQLTLDGTIFPDFGQVEVDPAVINLSDVETFYPEKRPFFIEGASILGEFGTGGASSSYNFNWNSPRLFYSRRIGRPPQGSLPDDVDFEDVPAAADILGATKLTGKLGDFSLGTLHAVTSAEQARIRLGGVDSEVPVEPLTYHGLLRVQRTMAGGRHGVGGLGTLVARSLSDPGLRAQLSKTAMVLGVDGWTTLDADKVWVLTGWSSVSRIAGTAERITAAQKSSVRYFQRPLADHLGVDESHRSLGGYAGRLVLNKQRGNVMLNASVGAISPGYEVNDLGYLARSDVINLAVWTGYRWTEPGRIFRSRGVTAAYGSNYDFGGTHVFHGALLNYNNQFSNYWGAWIEALMLFDGTATRATRGGPPIHDPGGRIFGTGFDSDEDRMLSGGLSGGIERFRRGAAARERLSGYLQLRVAQQINFRIEPEYGRSHTVAQYLETVADPTATQTFGQLYLFGELEQRQLSANLRASFIFTPQLSFELFVQPLVASLRYQAVRALAAPHSYDFVETGRDPAKYSSNLVSLRGSAVLRWEYRPGSTLYLVWNGNQANEDPDSRFDLRRRLRALPDLDPNHVFMAKLSWWWGR